MKTIFVVMEKSPLWGVRVSKVFDKHVDAISYRTECICPDGSAETPYDFDSAYKYWIEEWGGGVMRDCFSCYGEGVIDLGDEEPDVQPCSTCEGLGEVEDGCYCCAFCSCECGCGGWDGIECSCWGEE